MATLRYSKNLKALIFENNKNYLTTILPNCNGKIEKVNDFNKGFLTLQLEDAQGESYEEFIPLDSFLNKLGLGHKQHLYFKGINKDNIKILQGC